MKFVPISFTINFCFRGEVDDQEWKFLLTGGVALENPFANPASAWLMDKSWAEIVRASHLPAFKGFMEMVQKAVSQTCVISVNILLCLLKVWFQSDNGVSFLIFFNNFIHLQGNI